MITKLKIVSLLLIINYCLLVTPVSAITSPTPKPTTITSPTAVPTTDVANDIKERVQERIESIKQGAQKKAFWGTLKARTNSILTLESPTGEKKLKVDSQTIFIGENKKEIKITDLELTNFIIALGDWQGNGNLNAIRIIALTKAPLPAPKREVIFGKIISVNIAKKTIDIGNPLKPTTVTVSVPNLTAITRSSDPTKKLVLKAITNGDTVVLIGTVKEDESISAKTISILSSLPEKVSSPTPTITKTIKATPTPKKLAQPSPTPTE